MLRVFEISIKRRFDINQFDKNFILQKISLARLYKSVVFLLYMRIKWYERCLKFKTTTDCVRISIHWTINDRAARSIVWGTLELIMSLQVEKVYIQCMYRVSFTPCISFTKWTLMLLTFVWRNPPVSILLACVTYLMMVFAPKIQ